MKRKKNPAVTYTIEKGVAIPSASTPRGRLPGFAEALSKMEEGDSVYIPLKGAYIYQGVYYIAKQMNMKVALRPEGEGSRCWLVIKNLAKALEDAKHGVIHPGIPLLKGRPPVPRYAPRHAALRDAMSKMKVGESLIWPKQHTRELDAAIRRIAYHSHRRVSIAAKGNKTSIVLVADNVRRHIVDD
jgi:hypothetical protein